MRNIHFVSLLLIITLASCSSGTVFSPMTIDSTVQTTEFLLASTFTPTPKPFATVTSTVSEIPSPMATPWVLKSLVSPNEEFVANLYSDNIHPSEVQTIEIRDKEDELIWQIPFQGEMPTSDPHRSLNIFQWSNDGSQLYFCYVLSPDGGDRAFWWTGLDLQKLDIQTGEIEYVLPGTGFMSFAISPDGTQIAYTRQQDQPSVFYIRDLLTGSEKTAYVVLGSKKYSRVGDIRWSPTGKEIAFQTETDDSMVQTILLNPVNMKQRVIREYELFTLLFDGWADDGKLQFSKVSANGMRVDEVFQIDVGTFESLIIGTPTPRP